MGSSLKNKIILFSGATFLFLIACNDPNKDAGEASLSDCTPAERMINPNGSSDLSVLMRKMLHMSDSLKKLIKNGGIPERFPEEFLMIHIAKPTDPDTKKASYNGYATSYLGRLNTLYISPQNEIKQNYNATIEACLSCHSEHCPGPVKVIRKLRLEQ